MQRKSITTSHKVLACDVCGRTLLRGEHPDAFIAGGTRRLVCDLCTARATHEGWIREGLDDVGVRAGGRERRGSLLQRLRARREAAAERNGRGARRAQRAAPAPAEPAAVSAPPGTWADETAAPPAWETPAAATAGWGAEAPQAPAPEQGGWEAPEAPPSAWAAPPPPPAPAPRRAEPRVEPEWQPPREPRHVHAVPTNAELKMARALELFNASEHPRVVSGVARSLGPPLVAVKPSPTEGSIVTLAVAWELCWYRYEVDLADEASGVRGVGQGAELDELDPDERVANATADERGALTLSAA